MNQPSIHNLISSIRQDDLVLFSTLIKTNENLCIGRFPILTICLMYKANKILKKYFSTLSKTTKYNYVEEDISLYKTFKQQAGKHLRFFKPDTSVVTPIEYLAATKQDDLLKHNFKYFIISDNIKANLKRIYTADGLTVEFGLKKIKIQPRPFTTRKKNQHILMCIATTFVMIIIAGLYTLVGMTSGFGTLGNPFKIKSEAQLYQALSSDGIYTLARDITLTKTKNIKTFSGILDGNGYTITIPKLPTNQLLTTNDGTISNLNIVYNDISATISTSHSLLVHTNNGTIDNISVECNKLDLICNKSANTDINISTICINNYGDIENCKTKIISTITGVGDGECYFAPASANNYSSVSNFETIEGSNITLFEADASGVVGVNNSTATVDNCKNNCSITQTSDAGGWSPSIGGITISNYGQIQNCRNYSPMQIVSNYDQSIIEGYLFIGGVSARNYGDIAKSINNGDIKVTSKVVYVYAGGIAGYSSYIIDNTFTKFPKIVECGTNSNIDVTTANEYTTTFVGGIGGFFYGDIKRCYSITTFTQGFTKEKYYVGTLLGSTYLEYGFPKDIICVNYSENVVMQNENVSYQIGSLLNSGQVVNIGIEIISSDIKTLEDETAIKQSEVYWE